MRKCAVIIGVNKVGTLSPLSAAVQGAKEFRDWAISQNYDVKLHVDENAPVEVHQIKDSISEYVDSKVYSLIIIFFAGHGILKSPNEEIWLLSKADRDVGAAINLQQSRLMARMTGIPHVVFISDACRSKPENTLITAVSGTIIFPNGQIPYNSRTKVDMFYATTPGDPSYELPLDTVAGSYNGVYTKFLLKGLKGEVPELILQLDNPRSGEWGVMSYELDTYLQKVVPPALEDASTLLTQIPDSEITSRNPMSLAEFERPFNLLNKKVITTDPGNDEYLEYRLPENSKPAATRVEMGDSKLRKNIESLIEAEHISGRFRSIPSPNMTSVTIVGANDVFVLPHPDADFYREEYGVVNGRIFAKNDSHPILIKFTDASITPVAILPKFNVLVLIEQERVVNISYSPVDISEDSKYEHESISHARATIAAKARQGQFRVEGNVFDLMFEASLLRRYKAFDPTLGLYASYAYAQAGNFNEVSSVYRYMINDAERILFDVLMLKILFDPNFNTNKKPSTIYPSLTQGWSYLSLRSELFASYLLDLSSFLKPGLWTTFTEEGGKLFQKYLNSLK